MKCCGRSDITSSTCHKHCQRFYWQLIAGTGRVLETSMQCCICGARWNQSVLCSCFYHGMCKGFHVHNTFCCFSCLSIFFSFFLLIFLPLPLSPSSVNTFSSTSAALSAFPGVSYSPTFSVLSFVHNTWVSYCLKVLTAVYIFQYFQI